MMKKNKFSPLIIGIITFFVIGTILQHGDNKELITGNLSELIKKDGIEEFEIQEINLPWSYTIFNQKIISEFFILKSKKITVIKYKVIPKGGYPILSLFSTAPRFIRIDRAGMNELIR
tara:strand:+ start:81 stop:434 length:354 start_codon:yes stop_codon:yes gene_type:complete